MSSINAAVSAGGAAVGPMMTNNATANANNNNNAIHNNNGNNVNAAFPSLREAFSQAMLARLAGDSPPPPLLEAVDGQPLPPCPWVVSEPRLVDHMRHEMARLGLTHDDLGALIGRSGDYVDKVFNGLVRPTLDDLHGFQDHLNLNTENVSMDLLALVFLGEMWHTTGERYRLI